MSLLPCSRQLSMLNEVIGNWRNPISCSWTQSSLIDSNGCFRYLQEYRRKATKKEYDDHRLSEKLVKEILKDQALMKRLSYAPYLIRMIQSISTDRELKNKTFICIIAPSCTGKTQSFYVLDHLSRLPFLPSVGDGCHPLFHSVFHVLCNDITDQAIYRSSTYSKKFMDVVKEDFKSFRNHLMMAMIFQAGNSKLS